MLPRLLYSIALALVAFAQGMVVDARSPIPASKRGSDRLRYGDRNPKRGKFFVKSAFGNYDDDRMFLSHRSRDLELDQTSSIGIVQKLRGGDAAAVASSCKVSLMISSLDIFGTVVFSFSGALKAGRKGMDLIGMLIIACITAVGGGTVRDILMMGGGEEHVIFWMQTPLYIEISVVTALLTYFLWPAFEAKFGLEADSAVPVCTSDALGLSAFTCIGVQAAAKRGLAPTLWVVSSLITATFGGIIRDILCNEQPRVMYPTRTIYALGPLIGAITYTALDNLGKTQSWPLTSSSITLISFLLAFVTRVVSFNKPWRMPHWNIKSSK